jgi:hypothetical protein
MAQSSSLSGFCTRACFPRIAPGTCTNDVPLETTDDRCVPMGCGPNVDQPRHPWAEAFRVLDFGPGTADPARWPQAFPHRAAVMWGFQPLSTTSQAVRQRNPHLGGNALALSGGTTRPMPEKWHRPGRLPLRPQRFAGSSGGCGSAYAAVDKRDLPAARKPSHPPGKTVALTSRSISELYPKWPRRGC